MHQIANSDNWTDFERPCFADFDPDPDGDGPLECLEGDGDYTECRHLFCGGRWATCTDGALSRHCPECLRPKGLVGRKQ